MYQAKYERISAWLALTLLGCSACSQSPTPAAKYQETLKMTPQTAKFADTYKIRQLNAATVDIPLQVSLRIGTATDANVCETGELYGPYIVTNNTLEGDQSVSATSPTLRLANMGDLTVCMIITSPVDATLNLNADSLTMATTECNEAPANIAGYWTGDYSCTSNCGNSNGEVHIEIKQDNYSATYTDSEASYEGTVCGNTYKYSGSGPGYTESGTFVLNSDGTGSKTSTYVYTDGSCSGNCSDPVLQRYY